MNFSDQRTFPARMAMLAETAAFVEAFCNRAAVARDDALRLTLIVEELFTNTIAHGHRGDSDAPVDIRLLRDAGDIEIVFEDRAPAHDPTERLRTPPSSLGATLDERPVGGLGLQLVAGLAASFRYAREQERNRLQLVLKCRS